MAFKTFLQQISSILLFHSHEHVMFPCLGLACRSKITDRPKQGFIFQSDRRDRQHLHDLGMWLFCIHNYAFWVNHSNKTRIARNDVFVYTKFLWVTCTQHLFTKCSTCNLCCSPWEKSACGWRTNSFFNICCISSVNIRIDFSFLCSFKCKPPFCLI